MKPKLTLLAAALATAVAIPAPASAATLNQVRCSAARCSVNSGVAVGPKPTSVWEPSSRGKTASQNSSESAPCAWPGPASSVATAGGISSTTLIGVALSVWRRLTV